jgi:hypothetical protein
MTVDVEDRVRDVLHQQALEIEVQGPNAQGVFQRVRERRIRRRTTRTIVGVVAVAVIAVGGFSRGSTSTVQTGRADQPAAAALGFPAMVTLDAPGWHPTSVGVVGPEYTTYTFSDGTRSFYVDLYPLGSRTGNETNPTEVRLRGTTGITTDEGAPRYRVDWDEQGQTWEADGEPFTGINELLATLEHLNVVSETTWKASLPDGIGTSILANVDKGVIWYEDKGLSCFGPQDSLPCS